MSATRSKQETDERAEESATEQSADGTLGAVADREAALPLDQVFDVLKNQRRRLVLTYLKGHEQSVSTSDLAEHVAAHETGKSIDQISSDERKRAYVGLYQCHLPKMDSMDVVEFNKSRGIVRIGENGSCVDPYLGGADDVQFHDDVWAKRFLGLSGLSLLLLVSTTVSGVPEATMVGFAAATLAFCVGTAAYCRATVFPRDE